MRARIGLGVSRLSDASGIRSVQRTLLSGLSRVETDLDFVVVGEMEDTLHGLVDDVFESIEVETSQFVRISGKTIPVDLFHGLDYLVPLDCDFPVVTTIHDTMMIRNVDNKIANEGTERAIHMCARVADMIVVPSSYSAQCVVRDLGVAEKEVSVVKNAVSDEFFDGRYDQERLGHKKRWDGVILYCGGYAPRKNVGELIKAFVMSWERMGGDVTLICVNALSWGKIVPYLAQSVRGLEIPVHSYEPGGHVHRGLLVTEQLTEGELAWIYSRATVLCYPSKEEGFGLPPIEAMAMGLPVVASRIPSIEEGLSGAAMLVDTSETDALGGALMRVLTNPRVGESMRITGIRRAQHFTADIMAAQMTGVYERLLEGSQ